MGLKKQKGRGVRPPPCWVTRWRAAPYDGFVNWTFGTTFASGGASNNL